LFRQLKFIDKVAYWSFAQAPARYAKAYSVVYNTTSVCPGVKNRNDDTVEADVKTAVGGIKSEAVVYFEDVFHSPK
jgi:hypothetical protein